MSSKKNRRKKWSEDELNFFSAYKEHFKGKHPFNKYSKKKQLYLLEWFDKHLNRGKRWMVPCGVLYDVDVKNKTVKRYTLPFHILRTVMMNMNEMGKDPVRLHREDMVYANNFFVEMTGWAYEELPFPGLPIPDDWHYQLGLMDLTEDKNAGKEGHNGISMHDQDDIETFYQKKEKEIEDCRLIILEWAKNAFKSTSSYNADVLSEVFNSNDLL